jgi:hypothetical protein
MFEDKFIIINKKHLKKLTVTPERNLQNILKELNNKNKYYVVNQDEPYSSLIIDLILIFEDLKKTNYFIGLYNKIRSVFNVITDLHQNYRSESDFTNSHTLSQLDKNRISEGVKASVVCGLMSEDDLKNIKKIMH